MLNVHKGVFKDEFLFCIDLLSRTRRENIYQNIDSFFKKNNIKWEQLCGICADGAPVILGQSSGFRAQVYKVVADCTFIHCILHREALACCCCD